jgi:hypothetical protein
MLFTAAAGLISAVILGFEDCGTHHHILQCDPRLCRPGLVGLHIYIPQQQGGPLILQGNAFPSYDSHGYGKGIRITKVKVEVTLRPTASRPVRLGAGPSMGPITRF